ncbi:SEL1-like repeat protein [Campylobacter coli]
MYACGQGVEKDLIKAKELSSKACEKDTKLCFAQGWVELFNQNDILAQKLFINLVRPDIILIAIWQLIKIPKIKLCNYILLKSHKKIVKINVKTQAINNLLLAIKHLLFLKKF